MTVVQYLHSTAWAMLLAVDDVFFLNPIPCGAMTKYLGQVGTLLALDANRTNSSQWKQELFRLGFLQSF